jgi:hypothetical protein
MKTPEILLPVSVPWMISPSVPYLRIETFEPTQLATVTFIGFFKLEGNPTDAGGQRVIDDPGDFTPLDTAKGASHRLVRIVFQEGSQLRKQPAYSDLEVIPEQDYDWSNVPSGINDGETAEGSVARVDSHWRASGLCPDSGMYEVLKSKWISELELDSTQWHHYILLGHDEYIEVVARSFQWQPGQALP